MSPIQVEVKNIRQNKYQSFTKGKLKVKDTSNNHIIKVHENQLFFLSNAVQVPSLILL